MSNPLTEIDKTVHEPARLMLLSYLYVVERADALFLKKQTGLSWGNLSSHMSKLEKAGYVFIEKEFVEKKPRTILSLTKEGRNAFNEYRKQMQQILDDLPGDPA
jgi:DNA-binding MarR family transcriptional regulator